MDNGGLEKENKETITIIKETFSNNLCVGVCVWITPVIWSGKLSWKCIICYNGVLAITIH